jgi:predicted PurR-regulated permease PerM
MVRNLDTAPRTVLRTVLIVLTVIVTVYVVYLLRKPITWLVIAAFIAVALSGPVAALSRHMPRGLSIALVYSALVAIPIVLGALLIPPLVSQVEELANDAPTYAADVEEFVQDNQTLQDLNEDYDIVDKLNEEAAKLPERIGDAAGILSDIGVGLVNSIFAMVTILILSIFMVSSGSKWVERFVNAQEEVHRERMSRALNHIAEAIGNYVGGALIQATRSLRSSSGS